MAANTTQARAVAVANAWKQRAQLAVKLISELETMVDYNADIAIDWSNGDLTSGGDDITVDAAGNIDGLTFTPAQVSNAIGTLNALVTWIKGGAAPSTGDHLGNLNQLVQPLNLRADRV